MAANLQFKWMVYLDGALSASPLDKYHQLAESLIQLFPRIVLQGHVYGTKV